MLIDIDLRDFPYVNPEPYLTHIIQSTLSNIEPCGNISADNHTKLVLDRLANAGLLNIVASPNAGGFASGKSSGTNQAFLHALRSIGKADLAAGRIYEGHVNAMLLAYAHATPEQQQAWEADAAAIHWFGVWNTDAEKPVTMRREGNDIILDGAKSFCSGASLVTRALITAKDEAGQRQMLIVPMELLESARIDSSTWRPMGMASSDSFKVDFSGLHFPLDVLLGEPDVYLQEPWFSGGAIRFVAVQLGGVEALAEAFYAYMRQRQRSDDPFQQFRAGEIAVAVATGSLWINHAAQSYDQALLASENLQIDEASMHPIISNARMARVAVEQAALKVLQLVDRSVGANGLLEPLPFGQLHRDLTMYLRQPVPDMIVTAIGREHLF